MIKENYFEIYKTMFPNSIALTYKGAVTIELIDTILEIISTRLEIIEEDVNTKKKVYVILMECLQNLCSHIEQQEPIEALYDSSCALLSIENEVDHYSISTGNFIKDEKIDSLKELLDQINNCSTDELKKLYNAILTNGQFTSHGGGGLGFVDIARKSKEKLNYKFEPVELGLSFFSLEVSIGRAHIAKN